MRAKQVRQQPVSLQNKHPPLVLRMKYDAAQTTPENARHYIDFGVKEQDWRGVLKMKP